MNFGLVCEFRNPAQWERRLSDVYEDAIAHLCFAEKLGFAAAEFLEHHFVDDGYLPSPLIAASAVAARTKSMRVATNIALLPLYDPVRFAEDTAVLDAISNGRLDVGVAIGYRPVEYAGHRIDFKTRGARLDESVQILKRLWSGEAVTFHGRFFDLDRVKITPRPTQVPNPPLWIGGFTAPGMRRAARFGDGFTGLADKFSYQTYLGALSAEGKDPALARVRGVNTGFLVVSNDPDKTFRQLAPHVIYWANTYASWFEGSDTQPFQGISDEHQLRSSGLLKVLSPDEAITLIRSITNEVPLLETFSFLLAPPGVAAESMYEYIELFASAVMPAFK